MKTKIYHYIDSVSDGGAETLVKDYALHIDKNKYDFCIILNKPDFKSANYSILKKNNIRIISIYKRWNIFVRAFNHFFAKKYVPYKLGKIIKKEKPDVLHFHHDQLANVSNIKNLSKNIKLFYTCHNIPEFHIKKDGDEYYAAKYLIKNYNLTIIALHSRMKEELMKLLDTKNVIILNNGIDFTKFDNNKENKNDIRKELGIPEDCFVIGSTARFVNAKNHNFLVDIFLEVSKQEINSYLLLIGSGPLKQEIINKLKKLGLYDKTIIFEHRDDMQRILKVMDVFMLVSYHEGFSISLIEAQKMGLKCVCSNNSSLYTDNILSAKTFALDLNEPVEKWRDVILNEELRNENYNNINNYDIKNVVKKLEEIYES